MTLDKIFKTIKAAEMDTKNIVKVLLSKFVNSLIFKAY